jgi:hypothetical protein
VKPADDDVDLDNAFIGEDESSSSGSDLPVGESSSQDESDNEQEEKVPMDAAALNAEMDDLMNDLGLDSDESEEDLDDDDIDLR